MKGCTKRVRSIRDVCLETTGVDLAILCGRIQEAVHLNARVLAFLGKASRKAS